MRGPKLNVITECYANKCFFEVYLKDKLSSKYQVESRHTPKLGRDEIVKRLKRIKERIGQVKGQNEILLAIIDFEKGENRKFIDENFEFIKSIENVVKLARFKHAEEVCALIFDPNIEEAIVC